MNMKDHKAAQIGVVLWDEKGYTEGRQISEKKLKNVLDRLDTFPPERSVMYDILLEDMVNEGVLEIEGRRHSNYNGKTTYKIASDDWRDKYDTETLDSVQESKLDDPSKLTEFL